MSDPTLCIEGCIVKFFDSVWHFSWQSECDSLRSLEYSTWTPVILYQLFPIGIDFKGLNLTFESCLMQMQNEPALPASEAVAPSFNCPICIGPMSEETSTKCGHIFCKKCIEAAIKVQRKCPTCRHKLRMKDIIRIYLPTSI